jgi:hypothetical protein
MVDRLINLLFKTGNKMMTKNEDFGDFNGLGSLGMSSLSINAIKNVTTGRSVISALGLKVRLKKKKI